MSGNEDFLRRWSRRKRAAAEPAPRPEETAVTPATPSSPDEASAASNEVRDAAGTSETEEFDLANLPSIDSIVAGTDVSGFLKQGVPLDLTRAALRRAWSADPAIRDFIGLAENAWDFNDPNAIPGFGPLDQSPEEVRQMLARVMGEVRGDAEAALSSPEAGSATRSTTDSGAIGDAADTCGRADARFVADTHDDPQAGPAGVQPALPQIDVALQQNEPVAPEEKEETERPRRLHGGALPR